MSNNKWPWSGICEVFPHGIARADIPPDFVVLPETVPTPADVAAWNEKRVKDAVDVLNRDHRYVGRGGLLERADEVVSEDER